MWWGVQYSMCAGRCKRRLPLHPLAMYYMWGVFLTGGKGAVAVAEVLTTARAKTRKGRKSSKSDAVGLLDDTQETNFGI